MLDDAYTTCNFTGDMVYMLIRYKFIINHMNDIPAFVQETNITMYSDDTNLQKAFRTSRAVKQEMLPTFYKVCK